MTTSDRPFQTIESAHQFLALLSEQIDEVMTDVRDEVSTCTTRRQERRVEAWQVVLYSLTKLSFHISTSRRLVNDLRTLRNLLQRTSNPELDEISGIAGDAAGAQSPEVQAGPATDVQHQPGSDAETVAARS